MVDDNNVIKEIPAGNKRRPSPLSSAFSSPTGVAVDGSGNVFVADYGNKGGVRDPGKRRRDAAGRLWV